MIQLLAHLTRRDVEAPLWPETCLFNGRGTPTWEAGIFGECDDEMAGSLARDVLHGEFCPTAQQRKTNSP